MYELRPYRKGAHGSALSYNPFREMEELERRFFGAPFESYFRSADLAEFKTDIWDQGNSYLLEADLPGFDKKDIQLDISGDTLTIQAERHAQYEDSDKKNPYVHMERSYGKYSREFDVSMVDTDKINAKYDNGVLRLIMPKKQTAEPEARHLDIE